MSVPERGGYPAGDWTVHELPLPEARPESGLRWVSIGVRFPPRSPHYGVLPGHKAVVYDAKTGALLPAEILRIDAPLDGVVTVNVRLEVAEVTTEDGGQ